MPISTEQANDLLGSLIALIRTAKARSHRDGERSVSGTKIGVLRLVREDPARLGDLAGQLNVATSVVSRAVDVLEHEGLAERRPDPHDARACLVTITGDGRQRLCDREKYVLDLVAEELVDWTPPEAEQVIGLMQRLDLHISNLFEKFDREADPATRTQPTGSASGPPTIANDLPPPTSNASETTAPDVATTTSAPERTLENSNL